MSMNMAQECIAVLRVVQNFLIQMKNLILELAGHLFRMRLMETLRITTTRVEECIVKKFGVQIVEHTWDTCLTMDQKKKEGSAIVLIQFAWICKKKKIRNNNF